MDIVHDIISAVLKYRLSPQSSVGDLISWYIYAIEKNLVATVYENGKFQGFVDWVRLPRVPEDEDDARILFAESQNGPVLFVSNCAVLGGTNTIWKLKKNMISRNKSYKVICWHSKETDKMVIRRKNELSKDFVMGG